MSDVRASEASGATSSMSTAARESAESEAIAAMETADGYGGPLAVAQKAALRTAVARATEVGGNERGKSEAERAAAWRALGCN